MPSDGRTREVYSHSPLHDAFELSKLVAGPRFALFGGWLGPLLQPGGGGQREGASLPCLVQQRPGDWQGTVGQWLAQGQAPAGQPLVLTVMHRAGILQQAEPGVVDALESWCLWTKTSQLADALGWSGQGRRPPRPASFAMLVQIVGLLAASTQTEMHMPLDVSAGCLGLGNTDVLNHIRNDRTEKDIYCSVAWNSKTRENSTNLRAKERHSINEGPSTTDCAAMKSGETFLHPLKPISEKQYSWGKGSAEMNKASGNVVCTENVHTQACVHMHGPRGTYVTTSHRAPAPAASSHAAGGSGTSFPNPG